jgi:cytochrome oxidase Cu insertion factor (SCO1/SenC/PrrC family)
MTAEAYTRKMYAVTPNSKVTVNCNLSQSVSFTVTVSSKIRLASLNRNVSLMLLITTNCKPYCSATIRFILLQLPVTVNVTVKIITVTGNECTGNSQKQLQNAMLHQQNSSAQER